MSKEGRWREWLQVAVQACEELMPPLHSLVCCLFRWAHQFLNHGKVLRDKRRRGSHMAERVQRKRCKREISPDLHPGRASTDEGWRVLCCGLPCAWPVFSSVPGLHA